MCIGVISVLAYDAVCDLRCHVSSAVATAAAAAGTLDDFNRTATVTLNALRWRTQTETRPYKSTFNTDITPLFLSMTSNTPLRRCRHRGLWAVHDKRHGLHRTHAADAAAAAVAQW